MSKKIVAIGGGENGRLKSDGTRYPYELEKQDREIIKLTGKEHFCFAKNHDFGHVLRLRDVCFQEIFLVTMSQQRVAALNTLPIIHRERIFMCYALKTFSLG